jgi:uncharacterized repeat protein (TIGR03803 family)
MQHLSAALFDVEALEPRVLLSSGYALAADTSFIASPDGLNPTALAVDSSGNLFGATAKGGAWGDGTVFEIASGTSTVRTLVSFDGTNGTSPSNLSLDSRGDLFGTAGNADDNGEVFEIIAGSGTANVVAALGQGLVNYDVSGPLIYYAGSLYGAAVTQGVVFKLNPTTGTFTDLATFGASSTSNPALGLALASGGNLVGETTVNTANHPASVFEYSIGGGTLTTIATFDATETPTGGLWTDPAGDIFGTTETAATDAMARVFEIPHGTHVIDTVASFAGVNGGVQTAMTVDAAGDLYGTNIFGGADGSGSIFEVPHGTDAITTIASFTGRNGDQPNVPLVLGPNGDLFGTTDIGGTSNNGTVFRITGNALITIASFDATGATEPSSPLVADPGSNLFGTTDAGGPNGDGTIFGIPPGSNATTVIANFDADVQYPTGSLLIDPSGDLFGTAAGTGGGIVYELPHDSSVIRALATVPRLRSGLAIDAAGDLFGVIGQSTTTNRFGKLVPLLPASIFEISHATGTLTTVVQFGRGIAAGGISLDSAGDIFGTFSRPGSNDWTIFDIAPGARTVNPLAVFTPNGTPGPLAIDAAGDLFGAGAGLAIPDNPGMSTDTIFELVHGARQVKSIGHLPGSTDFGPVEPLAIDANGDVFGATSGVNSGPGAVFEISKSSGALSTLLAFNGTNGSSPLGVSLDPSGNLVGTTSVGGTSGGGVFFKLSPAQVPSSGPTQLAISSLPSTPIAGVPLNPTVTVSILDAAGQVVTSDNSTVTLTLSGKSDATTTATAVNGVATFSNLVITDPSPAVFLDVSDGTLTAGTELIVSQPFQLVPRLGIVRFPAGALAGSNVDVNAPLAITNTGKPFANTVQIALYANSAGDLDGNEVLIRSYSVPISLPAGGTMTLSLPIRSLPPALAAGTYHLLALLAEPDTVASLAASPQTVALAEPFIQPSLSFGAVSPATLTAGEVATVLVTVTNSGNVAARGIDLMLSASSDGVTPIPDVLLGRIQSTARIAPGHRKAFRLRFRVPSDLAAGIYLPYLSCFLSGVTAAATAPTPFNIARSAS